MVSFVCNYCQETLKKPKLDQHTYRCQGANFSCVDCNTDFQGISYRAHTSCISEAEKYQKSLYRAPASKAKTTNKKLSVVDVKEEEKAAVMKEKKSDKQLTESLTSDLVISVWKKISKRHSNLTMAESLDKVARKLAKKCNNKFTDKECKAHAMTLLQVKLSGNQLLMDKYNTK